MIRIHKLLLALTTCIVLTAGADPIPDTPVRVVFSGLPPAAVGWELLVTPSGSMAPTLGARTYVLCEPFKGREGSLSRSNIIAIDTTEGHQNDNFQRVPGYPTQTWISRLVGLPGDRIELKRGKLIVNGQAVSEAYADMSGGERALATQAEIVVPVGSMYVLSDNRGNSVDSRLRGVAPIAYIRGVIRYVATDMPGGGVASQWLPR